MSDIYRVPSGRDGKSRSDLPLLFFELYFKTVNNVGDEERAYTYEIMLTALIKRNCTAFAQTACWINCHQLNDIVFM